MKALTLWQPWASLIACGIKHHETRSWRAPEWLIGKTVAIHAGKTMMPDPGADLAAILKREFGAEWAFDLPRSAVVATATLEGCYPTAERSQISTPEDLLCGDWYPGRWAWHLTNVRMLEHPNRCPGARSLWDWYPPSARTDARGRAGGGMRCQK